MSIEEESHFFRFKAKERQPMDCSNPDMIPPRYLTNIGVKKKIIKNGQIISSSIITQIVQLEKKFFMSRFISIPRHSKKKTKLYR